MLLAEFLPKPRDDATSFKRTSFKLLCCWVSAPVPVLTALKRKSLIVEKPKKRGRPARKYCASGHSPESLAASTSTALEIGSSCHRDLFSEETNTSLSYFGSHDECLALPFASEELLVFDASPLPQMPSCPAPVDAAPASFAFPLATSHMYHPDNMWSCSFDAFCDLILPPVPVPVPQQVVGNPSLL
jgi:hypothetical protein